MNYEGTKYKIMKKKYEKSWNIKSVEYLNYELYKPRDLLIKLKLLIKISICNYLITEIFISKYFKLFEIYF